MIVEAGVVKAIAVGGGLVSGIALIAGMSGGMARQAAVFADQSQLAAAVCAYDSSPRAADRISSTPRKGLRLTAEQSANALIIIRTAYALGLPRRAAVIGIATALQESDLRNGAVGDNGKAFGLFQQHPEYGWGAREQVIDPQYAARGFFSRLVRVDRWQTRPLTVVAQAVQHSAHPDSYARYEGRALKIVNTFSLPERAIGPSARPTLPVSVEVPGLSSTEERTLSMNLQTAATLGVPREAVVANTATTLQLAGLQLDERVESYTQRAEKVVTMLSRRLCTKLSALSAGPSSVSTRAMKAVRAALETIGTPYSWGGGGPNGPSYGIGRGASTKGFDCSGLTEYAWAKAGMRIGTTTYEQWRAGVRVDRSQVRPGDLVFYETDPSIAGPDHVGLAISATKMVNAPFTGAVIRVEPIDRRGYMGAIRPR
ncbi:C40 family peptidase [Streptosporangium saharense]|uniref:C40 family peptidase n=1 Tax=Streptosporangium saharense TaxID=1706840 RepID=UPI00369276D9